MKVAPVEAEEAEDALVEARLGDGPFAGGDLDDAAERAVGVAGHAAEVGEAGVDGAAAVAVQALLEDADRLRLQVEREVAADQAARVADAGAARIGEQEQARVLDGAGGEHVAIGGEGLALAVGPDGLDAGDARRRSSPA